MSEFSFEPTKYERKLLVGNVDYAYISKHKSGFWQFMSVSGVPYCWDHINNEWKRAYLIEESEVQNYCISFESAIVLLCTGKTVKRMNG